VPRAAWAVHVHRRVAGSSRPGRAPALPSPVTS
jgi:hypothetical protein